MIKNRSMRIKYREAVVQHLIDASCTKDDESLLKCIDEIRSLFADYELAIDQLEAKLKLSNNA